MMNKIAVFLTLYVFGF